MCFGRAENMLLICVIVQYLTVRKYLFIYPNVAFALKYLNLNHLADTLKASI